jgi:hypothetical protein
MISIDGSGILRRHDATIPLGRAKYISSASRVFLTNTSSVEGDEEDWSLKIDEFDLTTGTKVRTLSTGFTFSDDGCDIHSVFSNDTAVYCIIGANGRLVIQKFLL